MHEANTRLKGCECHIRHVRMNVDIDAWSRNPKLSPALTSLCNGIISDGDRVATQSTQSILITFDRSTLEELMHWRRGEAYQSKGYLGDRSTEAIVVASRMKHCQRP